MAAKKTRGKKLYLVIRDSRWDQMYLTFNEAMEAARALDTILEISASWDVSSKLTFRKENTSEYV